MNKPRSLLNGRVTLWAGDCLDVLADMPADSVDAVVTDPPYHLASITKARPDRVDYNGGRGSQFCRQQARAGFMGKQWDGGDIAFNPATWAAVLRVLKPGGHMLAFAAPRNSHRMVCAIEDAGFEIRDGIVDLIASDGPVRRFLESLSPEQQGAFFRCLDDSSFAGQLQWIFGQGFAKSRDAWRLEAQPKIEAELRKQGVQGEIRWK